MWDPTTNGSNTNPGLSGIFSSSGGFFGQTGSPKPTSHDFPHEHCHEVVLPGSLVGVLTNIPIELQIELPETQVLA